MALTSKLGQAKLGQEKLGSSSAGITISIPSAVMTLAADGPTLPGTVNPPSAVMTLAADAPTLTYTVSVTSGVITLAAVAPTATTTVSVASAVYLLAADGPTIRTRTRIPITEITRDGVEPPTATDSNAGDGMYVGDNDGRVLVEIRSTDLATETVGFAITETIDGQPAHDKTVTVPAGATRTVGPFPTWFYNQPDGSIIVTPSVDATLKLRAYRLKRDAVILDG